MLHNFITDPHLIDTILEYITRLKDFNYLYILCDLEEAGHNVDRFVPKKIKLGRFEGIKIILFLVNHDLTTWKEMLINSDTLEQIVFCSNYIRDGGLIGRTAERFTRHEISLQDFERFKHLADEFSISWNLDNCSDTRLGKYLSKDLETIGETPIRHNMAVGNQELANHYIDIYLRSNTDVKWILNAVKYNGGHRVLDHLLSRIDCEIDQEFVEKLAKQRRHKELKVLHKYGYLNEDIIQFVSVVRIPKYAVYLLKTYKYDKVSLQKLLKDARDAINLGINWKEYKAIYRAIKSCRK